jgi:hypothetical protein
MAQSAVPASQKAMNNQPLAKQGQKLSYKTIPAEGNTWGYEVLINDKPYIRQLSVPGVPGNKGFASKNQAEETAKLVADKIRNNVMPPAVTAEELSRIITTVK